jgi:hypothetical protein
VVDGRSLELPTVGFQLRAETGFRRLFV